ncbi:hypothetical protein GCM10027259_10530 [Micromonospora palomenae]
MPPCPTRRVRANRRIRATTSCDVMPPGLSTTISPSPLTTAKPARRGHRRRHRTAQCPSRPHHRPPFLVALTILVGVAVVRLVGGEAPPAPAPTGTVDAAQDGGTGS